MPDQNGLYEYPLRDLITWRTAICSTCGLPSESKLGEPFENLNKFSWLIDILGVDSVIFKGDGKPLEKWRCKLGISGPSIEVDFNHYHCDMAMAGFIAIRDLCVELDKNVAAAPQDGSKIRARFHHLFAERGGEDAIVRWAVGRRPNFAGMSVGDGWENVATGDPIDSKMLFWSPIETSSEFNLRNDRSADKYATPAQAVAALFKQTIYSD